MKTIIKIIAIAFALFVLEVAVCSGQTCTTATCNAATVSMADFLAALPSNSNTNATVLVKIPSGSSSWTSGAINYTVPSAVTSLTIQGNTTVTWTGTPGTSSYAYTVADNTVISDSIPSNGPIIIIHYNSSQFVRITGLTFQGGSPGGSSGQYSKFGFINPIGAGTMTLRMDHNHFNQNTYTTTEGTAWVRVEGSGVGVIDHNVGDLGGSATSCSGCANGFQAYDPTDDTIGYGDGPWAAASLWGTANFLFIESNSFNGGAPNDCASGARFVMRYNTINNAYVGIQTHATKSTAGAARGCRAYEAYHNYITGSTTNTGDAPTGSKIGTSLVWGNTLNEGYYRFFAGSTDRNSTSQPETNQPNGWGYCGTAVTTPADQGSCWDGNNGGGGSLSCSPNTNNPSASGWPCMDGLGRGQGDALNGANTITARLNTVTSAQSWPHEKLEPIYLWMNSMGGVHFSGIEGEMRDITTLWNRDAYGDCNGSQMNDTNGGHTCSSFNGTQGTGYGLLSARPSTCTAGPGGSYGGSPTGSYGVAYWATDANSGNGELYVCTATNTWTPIYQPYVYPHPLVNGGTTFTWTQTVTPTGGGTITGGSSGTYASGTTIGPLTATPSTGYSLASPIWSAVTGSAGCSGSTNPCPSFSLTTNSTATATFVINSYTLSTATSGSGTGTVTCTPAAGSVNYNTPVSCVISPTGGSAVSTVTGCGGTWTTSPYGFAMPASNCTVTATFIPPAATPTFSPAAGSYGAAQTVTISTTTPSATILYTNNGSTPACPSTGTTYSTPVTVSTSQTLRAVACATGYASSAVGSAAYIINGTASTPSASPAAGTYTSVQSVTLSSSTSGATICYTTDGSTPTANGAGTCTHGTTYTTAISVSTSQTIKFIASKSGFTDSSAGSAAYVINLSPATTTIQCNPCVVRGTVTIQ